MEGEIFDKKIAFGLMPFETLFFEERIPYFIKEHYLRFKRACKIFNVEFRYKLCEFSTLIHEFIRDSIEENGIVKIIMFENRLLMNFRKPDYCKEEYREGKRLKITKTIKDRENILNYFKTFNYGINYIEDLRAKEKKYGGVLFLNNLGCICETAYANIFFRKENTLYTPEIRSGILNGVMRKKVIEEAHIMGYNIVKKSMFPIEFTQYEECFITNSVAGVFPVKSINQIFFNSREFVSKINNRRLFERTWNKS